jgi:hypothetical protein
MDRQKAVELLQELTRAEVAVVHSVNSRRGLTKKAAKEELKAIDAVFQALTGDTTTPEEYSQISN